MHAMTGMVKILKSGVKLFSVAIAFTLTIEFCARTDDAIRFGAPFLKSYTEDCLRTKDVQGLYVNVPNARFEKWQHNSLGFRGPEISWNKPPGLTRVVCLGTSETYGLYESVNKEWPAQLRSILPNSKYQVINASVVGMGMINFKSYIMKYVLPLSPDIIICSISPFFYASDFEKVQKNSILPKNSVGNINKKPNIEFTTTAFSNIRFLRKFKQVVKNAIQNSFPGLLQRFQRWEAESKELDGRMPKDAVSDKCIKAYKNDLSGLVDFIELRGIKAVLCTYPSIISRDDLIATYPVIYLQARSHYVDFSLNGMVDILNKLNEVTRTVAFEKGTLFVDSQALIPKSTEYFADHVHYTDHGAMIIADGIAQLIQHRYEKVMPAAVDNAKNNLKDCGG